MNKRKKEIQTIAEDIAGELTAPKCNCVDDIKTHFLAILAMAGPNLNVAFCNMLFDVFAGPDGLNLHELFAGRPNRDLVAAIEIFKSAKPYFQISGSAPSIVKKTGVNRV